MNDGACVSVCQVAGPAYYWTAWDSASAFLDGQRPNAKGHAADYPAALEAARLALGLPLWVGLTRLADGAALDRFRRKFTSRWEQQARRKRRPPGAIRS